jgi:hypothetical protein
VPVLLKNSSGFQSTFIFVDAKSREAIQSFFVEVNKPQVVSLKPGDYLLDIHNAYSRYNRVNYLMPVKVTKQPSVEIEGQGMKYHAYVMAQ